MTGKVGNAGITGKVGNAGIARKVANAGIAGNVSNICWHSSIGLQVMMGLLVIYYIVVNVLP